MEMELCWVSGEEKKEEEEEEGEESMMGSEQGWTVMSRGDCISLRSDSQHFLFLLSPSKLDIELGFISLWISS